MGEKFWQSQIREQNFFETSTFHIISDPLDAAVLKNSQLIYIKIKKDGKLFAVSRKRCRSVGRFGKWVKSSRQQGDSVSPIKFSFPSGKLGRKVICSSLQGRQWAAVYERESKAASISIAEVKLHLSRPPEALLCGWRIQRMKVKWGRWDCQWPGKSFKMNRANEDEEILSQSSGKSIRKLCLKNVGARRGENWQRAHMSQPARVWRDERKRE